MCVCAGDEQHLDILRFVQALTDYHVGLGKQLPKSTFPIPIASCYDWTHDIKLSSAGRTFYRWGFTHHETIDTNLECVNPDPAKMVGVAT